jgi:hypothetical protein
MNPDWGVRRFENELRVKGFEFKEPTRGAGKIFINPLTEEEVRIMDRPQSDAYRTESSQKRLNDYYYRYRTGPDQQWLPHTTIPNKR